MKKLLSEMTLEELWQLFPVSLVPHREEWKKQFSGEEKRIEKAFFPDKKIRISHIGSTAVDGIYAKNIVDILLEIPEGESIKEAAEKAVRAGYTVMAESEKRISLNKGYTTNGFAGEVFHLHIGYSGDNDEIYFRDYLRDNPDVASEYEKLKRELQKKYEHDRDGYTDAKTDFVKKYTAEAKRKYGKRY